MNDTITIGELFTQIDGTVSALKQAVTSIGGSEKDYLKYCLSALRLHRDYIIMLSDKLDRSSISNHINGV